MTESQLKKAIIVKLKANGPHRTAEYMGVSAHLLVMYAHGYSKPHKGTIEKLERGLSDKKTVKSVKKAANVGI